MKNNKKKKLNEDGLRTLLRREITKILEAEEVEKDSEEDTEKDSEESEEPGLSPDLEAATNLYIRKIKDTTGGVEDSDLVDMLSSIISSLTDSSEHRLSILRGVKSNIVR